MAGELVSLLADLKETEAIEYIENALTNGVDAESLMNETKEGMAIVGNRFANGEYFIPDLVFSGEILKSLVQVLEPKLKEGQYNRGQKLGKVIIGTVEGDIHDIGKDIVVSLLDVSGFEVTDLGIDVPVKKFIAAVKETKATVLALSGFLTLAFDAMRAIIDELKAQGLRDKLKIMIGGGQIDDRIKEYTGADAYGNDAMEAVKLARQWFGSK